MSTCTTCNKYFIPKPGSRGVFCSRNCMGIAYKERGPGKAHDSAFSTYMRNPKLCGNCQSTLPYEKRANSFCCKACAAKFNNAKRPVGHESRTKQANSIVDKFRKNPRPKKVKPETRKMGRPTIKPKFKPEGPHTRIYLKRCPYTGQAFYTHNKAQRHSSQYLEKMTAYKVACRFAFSLRYETKIFDDAAVLVERLGWYAPANSLTPNPKGVSRDHLFSVYDGFKIGIPPEILRHPANCQLIPHSENQKKHRHSSITLSELLDRIKQYDNTYGVFEDINGWIG